MWSAHWFSSVLQVLQRTQCALGRRQSSSRWGLAVRGKPEASEDLESRRCFNFSGFSVAEQSFSFVCLHLCDVCIYIWICKHMCDMYVSICARCMCAYVSECVCECIDVCSLTCTWVCVHVCRGQRSTWLSFLRHCLPLFSRQCVSFIALKLVK